MWTPATGLSGALAAHLVEELLSLRAESAVRGRDTAQPVAIRANRIGL